MIKIKNNEMDGACSTYEEKTDAYRVLLGKPGEREYFKNLDVGGK